MKQPAAPSTSLTAMSVLPKSNAPGRHSPAVKTRDHPSALGKRFTALTGLWRIGKQRPMSDVVSSLANRLPDLAILAVSAIAFAIFGGGIALAINKLWFQCWPKHSAFEDKLADTAHTSLIGLAALVLALMITNGFASLSKTEEGRETGRSRHLPSGRELDALGPNARDARQALAAYARSVADDEWPRLAALPNRLSPLAQKNLDDLWGLVRGLQRGMDPRDPVRGDLSADLTQIETLRESRLAAATSNIPNVFWIILLLLVAAASFLSGREAPKRFGMQVNLIHMAAIGLAVGRVISVNNPFRGQTSVDPAIIRGALSEP